MTSTPPPHARSDPPNTPDTSGDGDGDDHAHHRSGWPIVSAAGAAVLYVGFALLALAFGVETVPAFLGFAVALLGGGLLLTGLFGWLRQAFLRHQDRSVADPEARRTYVTTMILFLATDLGTFGAGFIYYVFVRVGTWPPADLPPLLGSLVAINTALLLVSSVTFHFAHDFLERGRDRAFLGLLGLTVLLGVVFLAGQALEYYEFVVHEGFSITDGVFASAFYGLTGLHGLHVALGVVLLSIVLVRGARGQYAPERDTSVATVGLYWHFVDAVWLFLVATLYVGAVVSV
ncbi:cytochrome c oxidase subunit 3 [Natronosalvus rutilus]|uniref:cytochrome c oxidase subunit 3 n=1 Tax=Natronosalvus rutilus TaxID=2953753 RepID=UPI003CCDA735